MAKKILLILMCALFFIGPIIGAVSNNDTIYTLRIMSEKQVKAGGRPEYTVTNENGEKITVVVSTVEGTVVKLAKGTYKVKEVKTTEGFVPQNGGEIEITLPHKNELGEEFNTCILGMKSDLKKNPIEFLTYEKEENKKKDKEKEEIKEEPKKEEIKESPITLGLREERKTQEKPEPREEEKTKAPKTGDAHALLDIAVVISGIAMISVFIYLFMLFGRDEDKKKAKKRG